VTLAIATSKPEWAGSEIYSECTVTIAEWLHLVKPVAITASKLCAIKYKLASMRSCALCEVVLFHSHIVRGRISTCAFNT